MYNYYLDECGNTGDLLKKRFDLKFAGQPLFALSCIGIDQTEEIDKFVKQLQEEYGIDTELKSSELYKNNPEFFLKLAEYIVNNRMPLLVELVDKKYCITTSIVNHHILPPYIMPDESDGEIQHYRNVIAGYLAFNLPEENFKKFNDACLLCTEESVLDAMISLRDFFSAKKCEMEGASKLVEESVDDYMIMKGRHGEEKALKMFVPIPDESSKGKRKNKRKNIKLLPHIHCIYNIVGRLNKYHLGDIGSVTLYHDVQDDYDDIFSNNVESLKDFKKSDNEPPIINADFDINESMPLIFTDSEGSTGVQVADLLAGFFVRYINDYFYKGIEVDDIYHKIFYEFRKSFHFNSPLGVNFVLPLSIREQIFHKFNF
ncbi:DUF3800 domain-containing protein [Vibrio sp. V15_P4S5T153]|uniref:DUF3800 domain-containing protein n=1 Tax=Vibrio sp. V15_P4S5T153 TaxID=1938669 RepID=UPI000B9064FB|nr:DUF3800 domain-containing protein [Vibrio sp. V15_P4S5T153]OXX60562.1 hypothetical protein B9J89_17205 [Vibrio sp. V15_P4S5T153]